MRRHAPCILLLLAPLTTLAVGQPDCVRPAPPPSSVPTIADCNRVLQLIAVVARLQHNMPLTWSRHPGTAAGQQQQLPAYFYSSSGTGGGNECEFVVDVDGGREMMEEEEDVFPTGDVVFVGRCIVQACLVAGGVEEGTVGSDVIGPRGVMRLSLRKKGVDDGGATAGGFLRLVNGTDGTALRGTWDGAENVVVGA